MASYTCTLAKHQTLTGTTVDTVTFNGAIDAVEVLNYSGATDIYFTVGASIGGTAVVATPTAAGDDCYRVPAGQAFVVPMNVNQEGQQQIAVVKLIGNGNAYSVTAV